MPSPSEKGKKQPELLLLNPATPPTTIQTLPPKEKKEKANISPTITTEEIEEKSAEMPEPQKPFVATKAAPPKTIATYKIPLSMMFLSPKTAADIVCSQEKAFASV